MRKRIRRAILLVGLLLTVFAGYALVATRYDYGERPNFRVDRWTGHMQMYECRQEGGGTSDGATSCRWWRILQDQR